MILKYGLGEPGIIIANCLKYLIMGLRNKRPRALNYYVNKKGAKSGRKIENAIAHYKKLQERITFEGETKWLKNALVFVTSKLRKYSININKI